MKISFKNPYSKSSKFIFLISLLWATVLFLLGSWWLYLIFNFENLLAKTEKSKIVKMISWEGGSFLILLLLLSVSLFILYLKDQKKTKNLQEFFASLTHELKTPLASIRLQSEVIKELNNSKNEKNINDLIDRLIQDTANLETQMDKILQLSRIERGGNLNLTTIKLYPFVLSIYQKMNLPFTLSLQQNNDITIYADHFALELVLKNLFENTRIHTKSTRVDISFAEKNNQIEMNYRDQGIFLGNYKNLGTLFYKHNSTKGSGIGLYLCYKLMEKMNGSFRILNESGLAFKMTFRSIGSDYA